MHDLHTLLNNFLWRWAWVNYEVKFSLLILFIAAFKTLADVWDAFICSLSYKMKRHRQRKLYLCQHLLEIQPPQQQQLTRLSGRIQRRRVATRENPACLFLSSFSSSPVCCKYFPLSSLTLSFTQKEWVLEVICGDKFILQSNKGEKTSFEC